MKLLVFAHTPPPHHGQSYMVRLMLDGFGGDRRRSPATTPHPLQVECYHVNARISRKLADIGDFRFGKFLLLLGFCVQAIWCRFRYGVENLYYIPAPGKRSALYRDWLVMTICRPFFKRIILHWHAAGLAKWLETVVRIRSRSMTFRAFKEADLSIVLSRYNRADAEKLFPRAIKIVNNGIPDPCPEFDAAVRPRREARFLARQKLWRNQPDAAPPAGNDPDLFKLAFLGHCTREKGLFDAIDGVAIANERLVRLGSPIRVHLSIAGEFINPAERTELDERIAREDVHFTRHGQKVCAISYLGFVKSHEKKRLFVESDCLCFPTYYYAESFGLVLIEAMAFGLPIVASRWRSIPEVLPANYPGLVDVRAPGQIADSLFRLIEFESGEALRTTFLQNFTLERHLSALADALRSVEAGTPAHASLSPAVSR